MLSTVNDGYFHLDIGQLAYKHLPPCFWLRSLETKCYNYILNDNLSFQDEVESRNTAIMSYRVLSQVATSLQGH